ncbi:L,D-transpeptidase [Lacticaseibacillus paracasei subsp. paracasei]|uniref:L,D-transpeptidase n=1 Tax=Lacticaseibacillus paracasei TaxID=1597 RepID=UPI00355637D6
MPAATDVMLQTFKSTGKYHNLNGLTYLSLYDKDGNWRGYINQQSITAGVSDGGAWLPANAYTTFTAANVNAYADFNQQKVATSGAGLVNQTVNISGQYHAFGGVVYYSIYDVRGKWLGYVDASQVKTTSSAAGLWLPHDGYLTTTQSGQMIYTNLDSFAGGRTTTANYQRTFRIMGEYKHYNGATYYSLYDGNGNWMGYLNSALGSESKEAQGVWMNYNANVLITASNAALYSSFFNMTRDTSSLYGGVYQVSGKYSHVNGTTYYSLYDGNRWLGYLASWATTPYMDYYDWTKPSQSKPYPDVNMYPNLSIEVDIAKQRVYIKNGSTNLYTMYVSTGIDNSTLRGHFAIQTERGYSFYNANEGMGARYWTSFLDHGVYLFHSVPTDANGNYIVSQAKMLGKQPGSHGCVRLTIPDAQWINAHIKVGTPVYIY